MAAREEDGVLVITPYKKQEFTEDQLQQYMLCADPVTGPEYLLRNFFFIKLPVKGQL